MNLDIKQLAKDHSVTSILIMYMLSDGIGEVFYEPQQVPIAEIRIEMIRLESQVALLEYRLMMLEADEY